MQVERKTTQKLMAEKLENIGKRALYREVQWEGEVFGVKAALMDSAKFSCER